MKDTLDRCVDKRGMTMQDLPGNASNESSLWNMSESRGTVSGNETYLKVEDTDCW